MDYQKAYQEAKDNGYSDAEIAQHLSGDEGKYKEAISSGYNDSEIIQHFTGTTLPPSAPPAVPTEGFGATMKNVAQSAISAALPSPETFNQPIRPTSGNPGVAALQAAMQTLKEPTRINSTIAATGGGLAQNAAKAAGAGPGLQTVAKVSGEFLADPSTWIMGPWAAARTGKALEKGVEFAGKEAIAGMETLSGVNPKAIKDLFEHPLEIITAQSSKKTGTIYGALKRTFGITEAEEKLIAKAGDRTPGVARTVAEQLEPKVKAGEATLGELIAARRAALKVSQNSAGSEKFLYGKDAQEYTKQLGERAKPILDAIKEVAKSKSKEDFLRLLPRKKTGSRGADYFKTIGTLLTAGATSPAAIGLYTLGAKGIATAAKPLASLAPIAGGAIPPILLRALGRIQYRSIPSNSQR